MSPVYLNPPPSSPIPFLEFKGDVAATNFSYLDKSHASDHEGLAIDYSWHPQEKVEKVLSYDRPNDVGQVLQSSSWPQNYMEDGSGCSYGHSSNHKEQDKIKIVGNNEQKHSKKWKPSKVRIMHKMMTTSKNIGEHKLQHDLEQHRYQTNIYKNNNNNNNNGIRVCADCHTTTTPLWRSGPQGPKSLCNACGIRQRKARRAAMAAAAAAAAELAKDGIESSPSPVSMEAPRPRIHDEEERERGVNHHGRHPLPLKKRGKMTFEDSTPARNNSNCNSYNAKSQRAFPRDEEEGAILLMALSCGLACSS